MSFGADMRAIVERTKGRIEDVITKTALDMQAGMVNRAPVDTGRLRANFQVGLGQINGDTSDPPGADAVGRTAAGLQRWKPGQTIYLTNSLPYAVVAEYGLYGKPPGSANGPKTRLGYSSQAVGGFVRLTVQDFTETLRKAAASVR